jgi:lysophospholipid acyltransferase (LPLAT)-like uncharacterized protein
VVVPQQPKWHGRLGAWLIYCASRSLAASLRVHWDDQSGLFIPGQPRERVIFAVWHNRLGLCLPFYDVLVKRHWPECRLAGLVSASRDGGMLARVMELYGGQPVRGSSSRRGAQALLELTSLAEQGCDIAITPDGPRGPRYVAQEGVISLAQLTGYPIVLVSYHLSRKWQLNSWDRFQIPLPGARCSVTVGKPLRVPREANESQRESLRKELENRLIGITHD